MTYSDNILLREIERQQQKERNNMTDIEKLKWELKVSKLEHKVALDSLAKALLINAELQDENIKLKNFLEQLQSTLVDAYENIYGILEDK